MAMYFVSFAVQETVIMENNVDYKNKISDLNECPEFANSG
jgi:hypothetical protein